MRKKRVIAAAITVMLIAGAYTAHQLSPWPYVLLTRYVFAIGAARASATVKPYLPSDISIQRSLRYGAEQDAVLDLFAPSDVEAPLPAVVWVHGGGFVAGSRADLYNYLQVLASRGFVTVAIDYSRAPGARFPTPVRQTNEALSYLLANAERFHIDPRRLFLAGDSAGAQIAAQSALVISDPRYARRIGVEAGISREVLRGVILFCGPHDPTGQQFEWPYLVFVRSVVRSYLGSRDLQAASVLQLSVTPHVSASFPPAFISVGNDDRLAPQSVALANALRAKNVAVETLFFPEDYDPPLGHEYQLFLSKPEARQALDRYVAFLSKYSAIEMQLRQ
jgi:acetyl esterase